MADTPRTDPTLLDLLVEWEELRAAGLPASPTDLCRDCPEHAEELGRRVRRISQLDPFFDAIRGGPDALPAIPGFALIDEVGRGGMGVVYRARDLSLDRVVAVKVPFGEFGGDLSRVRFEREGRTLAKLRHPNIVAVHAAGVVGDVPYIVMEYVPGGSLADRIGGLVGACAQTVAVMTQVCQSVGHAHEAGVVHQDLKPSNILVDRAGRPLVSDFGIAALLNADPPPDRPGDTPNDRRPAGTRITYSAAGTPAYSPPESFDPIPPAPTPAADVWSLGVILYECLTGRRPYPDSGATGAVCGRLPPRPRALRSGISRDFEAVVLKCLSVCPRDRYPTARELAQDLDSVASGRPVAVRSRSWPALIWQRSRPYVVRPPAVVVVVVAGAVLGVNVLGQLGHKHERGGPGGGWRAKQASVARALAAGETYTFSSDGLDAGPFRSAVGSGGVPQAREGGGLVIASPGTELVELLPAIPCEEYEITARVQVEDAGPVGDARVGLYLGFAGSADPGSPGAWAAITFSVSGAGSPLDHRSSRVTGWFCPVRVPGSLSNVALAAGPGLDVGDVGRSPRRWRTMRVQANAQTLRFMLQGDNGMWHDPITLSSQECGDELAAAAQRRAKAAYAFDMRGGVGLYSYNCRAAFAEIKIAPRWLSK